MQPSAAKLKDDAKVELAKTRLLKLKSEHKSWHRVADYLGINVRYVWEFYWKGMLPSNVDIRRILMSGKPADKEIKEMDPLMQRLHYVLSTWHVGKGKAIKKRDLLKEIFGDYAAQDESYNNQYDRRLRSMIEELNHDHEGLICSTPDAGYFWAGSLSEGLSAVEQNTRRAATQMDNAHRLERNLKQKFGGQLEMKV